LLAQLTPAIKATEALNQREQVCKVADDGAGISVQSDFGSDEARPR